MTKKILILLIVVIILVAAGAAFYVYAWPNMGLRNDEQVMNRSWTTFQNYLSQLKAHDIEGLSKYSYKLSKDCKDITRKQQCFALMDSAYAQLSVLKKEDFKNIAWDQKQIILTSDKKVVENSEKIYYLISQLFFVVDGRQIKLLAAAPAKGWSADKAVKGYKETIDAAALDTDKDGIEDKEELCEFVKVDCEKSDPKKNDTNGDGWWDGIELNFI